MGDPAVSAAHETVVQWLSDNWFWVLLWMWVLGVFGTIGEHWRKAVARRRQHQINMTYARRGIPPPYSGAASAKDYLDEWDEEDEEYEEYELVLPAAAIPSPPSARHSGPGPCQHEKIVPVIDDDGELLRWICANYPRCEAEFHKSVAIYEPRDP